MFTGVSPDFCLWLMFSDVSRDRVSWLSCDLSSRLMFTWVSGELKNFVFHFSSDLNKLVNSWNPLFFLWRTQIYYSHQIQLESRIFSIWTHSLVIFYVCLVVCPTQKCILTRTIFTLSRCYQSLNCVSCRYIYFKSFSLNQAFFPSCKSCNIWKNIFQESTFSLTFVWLWNLYCRKSCFLFIKAFIQTYVKWYAHECICIS